MFPGLFYLSHILFLLSSGCKMLMCGFTNIAGLIPSKNTMTTQNRKVYIGKTNQKNNFQDFQLLKALYLFAGHLHLILQECREYFKIKKLALRFYSLIFVFSIFLSLYSKSHLHWGSWTLENYMMLLSLLNIVIMTSVAINAFSSVIIIIHYNPSNSVCDFFVCQVWASTLMSPLEY